MRVYQFKYTGPMRFCNALVLMRLSQCVFRIRFHAAGLTIVDIAQQQEFSFQKVTNCVVPKPTPSTVIQHQHLAQ